MKTFTFLTTISLLLVEASVVLAQPGLPSPPSQTPLGGLEILALIGGGYAIKKIRDLKKQ